MHSQHTCKKKNCVCLSSQEITRLKSSGKKDQFQHGWLLDPNIAYCQKTGYFWLLYEEGVGMFCFLCKKHNAKNLQNKTAKFNSDPSVRFKRTALIDHRNSNQHRFAVEAELTRRGSVFHKEVQHKEQSRDDVYQNAFLTIYWLAKEELPNKKLNSLLDLTERLGLVDMKFFKHRSCGSAREMFLLLGEMVKLGVVEDIKKANTFGLLTDEVCDIAHMEQLVTFINFVDVKTSKVATPFLAVNDLLKDSNSADATTIKSQVMKQLDECHLDVKKLSGLATDGCSVMTGKTNGVAAQLRKESPLLLNVHCICHRLALACGDANNDVSYIKTVEKILTQLWSFFDNSAKRTAAYGKAVMAIKEVNLPAKGRKKVAKSFKKACRTRWLSMDKAIEGVHEDFEALCQTLRVMKEDGDALATGLLKQIGNIKFLSAVYLLHAVLPALAHLSRAFQKGNVSFAAITPAIQYTVDTLQDVALTNKPLESLKQDLGQGGRLSNCDLHLTVFQEQSLATLTQNYVTALKENIESRFENSLPVLTSFKIFDPTTVPPRSDPSFKEHGVDDIKTMADHFYKEHTNKEEMAEDLLCEWQKFKYNLLQFKDEIPSEVLSPPSKETLVATSPTEWCLQKMLSMRATYQHFVPGLLHLAEVCLSLPVSNAWPERGASAVKRLKTRMRSSIKNDMLSALMHITLNGPDVKDSSQLIEASVKKWMTVKPRRKIAKGKGAARPTYSDASVQADLDPALTPDSLQALEKEAELLEEEAEMWRQEVSATLKLLNLPHQDNLSDTDSDDDSEFGDFFK